jgi:hypothetical protein
LINVTKGFSLKPGKSATLKVAVGALDLPAGAYTILAKSSSTNGSVNTTTTGPSVAVAAPFVAISGEVSVLTPSILKVGHTGTFKLTLTNTGNINSTGLATIAIGLSSDGATLAVPLTPFKKSLKLVPGKPLILTLHVKIPKGFAGVGNYFLFITFTQGATTFDAVGTMPFSVG